MPFELDHVHAFLAVAENGTIGRGARALNVAQPVLSRVIRALEKHLGSPLFSRHAQGVELTEAGTVFLAHARFLAAESSDAVNAIEELRGLRRGTLKIGAMGSALRSALPGAIDALLQVHPGVTAFVLDGPADLLATKLVQREVDLVIASDLVHTDEIRPLGVLDTGDTVEVVAGAGHVLADRRNVAPQELMGFPWVLSPRATEPRELLEGLCGTLGLAITNIAVEARSATSVKALLASGRYLGWLSAPHYEPEAAAGLLCRIDVPGFSVHRRFVLYCRRFGVLPPAARALVVLLAPRAEMIDADAPELSWT